MQTYIIEWTKKNCRGAWRDYRKVVKSNNIGKTIHDLDMGYGVFGRNGMFLHAVEVEKADRFAYDWKEKKGGEYWYSRNGKVIYGTVNWDGYYYDYKLKKWFI